MSRQEIVRPGVAKVGLRSALERTGPRGLRPAVFSGALVVLAVGSTLLAGDPEQGAAASLAGYLYWMGIGGGAAVLLGILRLTRAEWRRPLVRPAEFLALLVPLAVVFYPLARSWRDELTPDGGEVVHLRSLWPWSHGSQGLLLDLAVALPMFALVALLFWIGTRPDLGSGRRPMPAARLRVWSGLEMVFLIAGLAWFGWGFGMTRIPGWETTLFGPYFVVTSLLHGAAALGLLTVGLSWLFGLEKWVTPHHLAQLSKVMIGLVLIWFYVQFAEFLTVWYGNVPRETAILRMRTIGAHPVLFGFVAAATFVIPLLYLSFPGLRRRVGGVAAICGLIVAAGFVEWMLLFAPGGGSAAPSGFLRMLLLPGALGLLVSLLLRFLPPLSVWEMEEGVRARGAVRIGDLTLATYPLVDLPGEPDGRPE